MLESKYRVDERMDLPPPPACFTGTDSSNSAPILFVELDDNGAAALGPATSVQHMHLARILAVAKAPAGGTFAICERVSGKTLQDRLAEGTKPAVDAVRSALRVADALSTLHEAGAVHGAVTPANVVVEPEGRDAPVLAFGHPGADAKKYHSPARAAGGRSSEADDAWAVAALLHAMLIGSTPPVEGYSSEDALLTAGVADAALRAALSHALNKDEDKRSKDLRPLKRELARWFVEHAGEEPIVPGSHSSPPPLPPSQTPIAMSPATSDLRVAAPAQKKRRVAVLAAGGIILGLAGGWIVSTIRSRPRVEVREVAPKQAAPEKKAIDLGDVPVTGVETATVSMDKTASCVAGYLPKGSFGKAPDFNWICDEADPRTGADKLRVAVVGSAPKGVGPTEAMKIFARIGWYDMAAYATVRAGCCAESKPLELPAPSPTCGDMAESLREVGKEVVAVRPADEALKKYTAAIHCELNSGRGATFRRNQRPTGGEDSAFLELVKAIQ